MVTNPGNVALGSVQVTDNRGVTVQFVGGDANANGRLDITEAWTFQATGTAVAGQYANIATATGNPVEDDGSDIPELGHVSDTDPSHYFGVVAGIQLEKSTNGQDADLPPGPSLFVGQTATWTYVASNTGNVALSNVSVRDDNGTPADAADDFSPTFAGGDINSNSLLDLTERWTYTASRGVTEGAYRNEAVVTAQGPRQELVTDTDPSNFLGIAIFSKRRFFASSLRRLIS